MNGQDACQEMAVAAIGAAQREGVLPRLRRLDSEVKLLGGREGEVSLLIDLKTTWETTYPVLRQILREYSEMLTRFEGGKLKQGAVLVVISGNRSKQMFAGENVRWQHFQN